MTVAGSPEAGPGYSQPHPVLEEAVSENGEGRSLFFSLLASEMQVHRESQIPCRRIRGDLLGAAVGKDRGQESFGQRT